VRFFSPELLKKIVGHFDAARIMRKQVNTLSSGELQLIMIVICFLSEKELWLMDEPFQFLDERTKGQLAEYMSKHLKQETTLILITHNDNDLRAWTDKRMAL
jgi:ABC-type Mn2+/Zn2+ transport system ATPase subunit